MADENMKETISALVDGELDAVDMHDAIRSLRNDEASRVYWDRYHVIGDALRKSLPPQPHSQFLADLHQAIESEPPLQAAPVQRPSPFNKPRVLRPVAGFALAASVAALAYVGIGPMMMDVATNGAGVQVAEVNQPAPAMTVAETVPAYVAEPKRVNESFPDNRWNVAQPAVESRLDNYLSSHQAMTVAAGFNSRMFSRVEMVSDNKQARGE